MSEPDNPAQAMSAQPGQRRRTYLIQGLLALLVLVVAVFLARSMLQSSPSAGSRPVPERQARLVDTVALEASDYQPTITGWGTLIPSRELSLTAQASGPVEMLSPGLEPGLRVSPGEILVQLETKPYRAALVQAQSALAEARANLALEQGQQAVAQREFELLTHSLSAAGQPGSEDPAQAMNQGLALRQPQLDIARAAVTSAQARLDEAQLNLERATLKAPFEALVSSRSVTLGTQVGANTEIARLVGVGTWWVEVLVPSEKLAWLDNALGEPGGVTLRQPGVWPEAQSRPATLLRVLQELETGGNLARVLVAVDNPLDRPLPATGESAGQTPKLLLGSFLRADIPGQPLRNVFVLEPGWLRENSQVWLMDAEGTLRFRTVEVLYRDEEAVVVRTGLHSGDRLVTSRLSAPAEGMPLRATARTDERPEDTAETAGPSHRSEDSSGDDTAETESPGPEAAHG